MSSRLARVCLLAIMVAIPASGDGVRNGVVRDTREAAASNVTLSGGPQWAFGGKAQRGWSLYLPLISSLLKTEGTLGDRSFSDALSGWQRNSGLNASGILDQQTFLKMVGYWQGRRARSHAVPGADRLVTVPGSEFFDPERPLELRQVEREAYLAYKRMLAAAVVDLRLSREATGTDAAKYFKIISAFRSPEYQRLLRAQSPGSGRAGLAVNSPHFTGRALDIYVGGEPVSTRDQNRMVQVNSPAYRWLVRNAARFGFIPYFYEPWHWEYNPEAV